MKNLALILFFAFVFSTIAFAQTTAIQGVLRDPSGKSVENGNYEITFKLYQTATGGTAIWDETLPSVNATNGVFTAKIGAMNALPVLDPSNNYYLGFTIAGASELTPRMELVKSFWSINAQYASNFTNATNAEIKADNDANGSGDVILKTGNTERLRVENGGNVNVSGALNLSSSELKINGAVGTAGQVLTTDGSTVYWGTNVGSGGGGSGSGNYIYSKRTSDLVVNDGSVITWQSSVGGIPISASKYFMLEANKTYKLITTLRQFDAADGDEILKYAWYDSSTGTALQFGNAGNSSGKRDPEGLAMAVYTPSVDTKVMVKVISIVFANTTIESDGSFAFIEEMSSSSGASLLRDDGKDYGMNLNQDNSTPSVKELANELQTIKQENAELKNQLGSFMNQVNFIKAMMLKKEQTPEVKGIIDSRGR